MNTPITSAPGLLSSGWMDWSGERKKHSGAPGGRTWNLEDYGGSCRRSCGKTGENIP